jgi:hypothetical protein
MATASRSKAEAEFDECQVVEKVMAAYRKVSLSKGIRLDIADPA